MICLTGINGVSSASVEKFERKNWSDNMGLSSDNRVLLMELMGELESDCEQTRVLNFVSEHRDGMLDELTARPGFDQVRAAVVRLLPTLVEDAEVRMELLARVGEALLVAPEDVAASPIGGLTRQPAWIGLCLLEVADQWDSWDGCSVERAVELAARVFKTLGETLEMERGEVLWAMAEQAEEAGWGKRGGELLEAALDGPFVDPSHRVQVLLLAAMQRMRIGQSGGEDLLDQLLNEEAADDRSVVHASWIKAHLAQSRGERKQAHSLLEQAFERVNAQDEPDVANRLTEMMAELINA